MPAVGGPGRFRAGSHDDPRVPRRGARRRGSERDSGRSASAASTSTDLGEHRGATRAFVEREYGRLDVLVNNAAVCYNDATLYGKVPYTPFEEQAGITVRTNFFGSLEVTRALLPLLRKSSSPRIINVASAAGRLRGSQALQDKVTSPDLTVEALEELMRAFVRDAEAGEHVANGWPNTCYGVSKLGLIALTRVLARDEPSIMVNAVDPGWCKTDQNLMQGPVSAERGATTPALLATLPDEQFLSGGLTSRSRRSSAPNYSGVTRALSGA